MNMTSIQHIHISFLVCHACYMDLILGEVVNLTISPNATYHLCTHVYQITAMADSVVSAPCYIGINQTVYCGLPVQKDGSGFTKSVQLVKPVSFLDVISSNG